PPANAGHARPSPRGRVAISSKIKSARPRPAASGSIGRGSTRNRAVSGCFPSTCVAIIISLRSVDQERTWAGLLDEVDGVPLALDRARLFLSGCRNSNLDEILTSALLAHPGRALDLHIGRIAVFDIEPAHFVEIQGSHFTGRVAEAFSRALGILGRHDRLEHAFCR